MEEILPVESGCIKAIELPEGANCIELDNENYFPQVALAYSLKEKRFDMFLTDGDNSQNEQIELLGWSDEITEEQLKPICEYDKRIKHNMYYHYEAKQFVCHTRIESLHSLLQSHGITERKYLIFKKK